MLGELFPPSAIVWLNLHSSLLLFFSFLSGFLMTVIIPNATHFRYFGNDFQAQLILSVLEGSLKILLLEIWFSILPILFPVLC